MSNKLTIDIKLLSDLAKLPTQAHEGIDAGWDLYSADESAWLRAGERRLFKTDIAMSIPVGYFGRIMPRSGLTVKWGLTTLAGVIDSGFFGNIQVCLFNTNGGELNPVYVEHGQKIAQIIILPCPAVAWNIVDALGQSARGAKGFGSSGN